MVCARPPPRDEYLIYGSDACRPARARRLGTGSYLHYLPVLYVALSHGLPACGWKCSLPLALVTPTPWMEGGCHGKGLLWSLVATRTFVNHVCGGSPVPPERHPWI